MTSPLDLTPDKIADVRLRCLELAAFKRGSVEPVALARRFSAFVLGTEEPTPDAAQPTEAADA